MKKREVWIRIPQLSFSFSLRTYSQRLSQKDTDSSLYKTGRSNYSFSQAEHHATAELKG